MLTTPTFSIAFQFWKYKKRKEKESRPTNKKPLTNALRQATNCAKKLCVHFCSDFVIEYSPTSTIRWMLFNANVLQSRKFQNLCYSTQNTLNNHWLQPTVCRWILFNWRFIWLFVVLQCVFLFLLRRVFVCCLLNLSFASTWICFCADMFECALICVLLTRCASTNDIVVLFWWLLNDKNKMSNKCTWN